MTSVSSYVRVSEARFELNFTDQLILQHKTLVAKYVVLHTVS